MAYKLATHMRLDKLDVPEDAQTFPDRKYRIKLKDILAGRDFGKQIKLEFTEHERQCWEEMRLQAEQDSEQGELNNYGEWKGRLKGKGSKDKGKGRGKDIVKGGKRDPFAPKADKSSGSEVSEEVFELEQPSSGSGSATRIHSSGRKRPGEEGLAASAKQLRPDSAADPAAVPKPINLRLQGRGWADAQEEEEEEERRKEEAPRPEAEVREDGRKAVKKEVEQSAGEAFAEVGLGEGEVEQDVELAGHDAADLPLEVPELGTDQPHQEEEEEEEAPPHLGVHPRQKVVLPKAMPVQPTAAPQTLALSDTSSGGCGKGIGGNKMPGPSMKAARKDSAGRTVRGRGSLRAEDVPVPPGPTARPVESLAVHRAGTDSAAAAEQDKDKEIRKLELQVKLKELELANAAAKATAQAAQSAQGSDYYWSEPGWDWVKVKFKSCQWSDVPTIELCFFNEAIIYQSV